MQLREKEEKGTNFVFRLGISGSGIDNLFIESGIYDSTALGKIIDGKHEVKS